MEHAFWKMVNNPSPYTADEQSIIIAVTNLSISMFKRCSMEDIYDMLCGLKVDSHLTTKAVVLQLAHLEEVMSGNASALARIQADQQLLVQKLTSLQAAMAAMAQAQTDANARLIADIAALRNNSGSGDPAALDAIATSLEQTAQGFQAVTDQLNASASAEIGVDPGLTISPSSGPIVRNQTQQFTTNLPAAFSASAGSIDSTGLFTPPTDTSITSVSITATTTDGTGKTASASMSIVEPSLATGSGASATGAPAPTTTTTIPPTS